MSGITHSRHILLFPTIMTAKEKAFSLFCKYYRDSDLLVEDLSRIQAKECALIAVDELLEEFPSQCPKDSYEMERHIYWLQVKEEIQKL